MQGVKNRNRSLRANVKGICATNIQIQRRERVREREWERGEREREKEPIRDTGKGGKEK